ncbi:hypothetical protein [Subtercola boreus]|uniref:Uncharacterized protein n=1 Tax=Subtercola boreus TaxID=120213 RepID=A0A3E0WA33_9MICO|nr:hypothetical protein [Subtercola boreus]RFA19395.1 hypothetical protein B7R24_12200 [Subtercola boreus]RFA19656.1 hypothetical protein B7R23_12180 [Subtercola boreus]RFA26021.1 hypothetical protein B7R25_12300 [Subtercola boreus]
MTVSFEDGLRLQFPFDVTSLAIWYSAPRTVDVDDLGGLAPVQWAVEAGVTDWAATPPAARQRLSARKGGAATNKAPPPMTGAGPCSGAEGASDGARGVGA